MRALARGPALLTLALAGLAGCAVYYPAGPPVRHAVIVEPPRLVVIAGSDIRYCGECDDDVFFYLDTWYAYREGLWYRCPTWGGSWVVVETGRLPAAFIRVPPDRFRYPVGRYHPAHDHHPDMDTWPARAGGDGNAAPDRGRGQGRGRGRGHAWGRQGD